VFFLYSAFGPESAKAEPVHGGLDQLRLIAGRKIDMPKPPLPDHVVQHLQKPNHAVVASIRPNGMPHTAACWYEFRDGRLLLSLDNSRARLRYMRENPRVSLTALDFDDWSISTSIWGDIVEIVDDEGLRDIDVLALRYLKQTYPDRESPRTSVWVEPTGYSHWNAYASVNRFDKVGDVTKTKTKTQ
jgi:hypothetical protein